MDIKDIVAAGADAGAPDARVASLDGSVVQTVAVNTAGGVRMENGKVSLEFNADAGYALDDLRFTQGRNLDLLYHKGEATQSDEQLAGISYFQHDYSWNARSASLAILVPGPVVSQVKVEWNQAGNGSGIWGRSIYTLHPDGRLLRDEWVNVDQPYDDGDSWLVAYTAINASLMGSAGALVQAPDAGVALFAEVHEQIQTNGEGGYGCVWDPDSGEAVAWANRPSSDFAGWRLWSVFPSFLLATDWMRESSVPTGVWSGDFLTILTDQRCEAAREHVTAFVAPPRLVFTKGSESTEDAMDHDKDGYSEGGGYYTLNADVDRVEVTLPATAAPVPSCTLRIETNADAIPTVELDGTTLALGQGFLAGRGGSGEYWIHLTTRWEPGTDLKVRWW
ncbi:MAG: hypothetical protein QM765_34825 [Myxococcales bacterium]